MKPLIALYFFILATIQLGLLAGTLRYYRTENQSKPSSYWVTSLALSFLALSGFGVGVLVNQSGAAKPEFNFTIANSLFYAAAILQLLFCHSLNVVISKRVKILAFGSVGVFAICFEFMRIYGNFEIRTISLCLLLFVFYLWQVSEIRLKRKSTPSIQLGYLQYATVAEIFFAIGRIVILVVNSFAINRVDEIPQVLIFFTIAQLVMNTLAYISIGAYWTELMVLSNVRVVSENEEIKALLSERESLIRSLLRVNKTAATGALSASIAHELNQPLGASQLNIQFLQKKLAEGALSPEQHQEVLASLLADNRRAAGIIQSLRSIFTDGKIGVEEVDINELIESVLRITRPETHAKNIQVVLKLSSSQLVNLNRSEILQVLLNLINNAIHSLAESQAASRVLTIETHDIDDAVKVRVCDNGLGLDDSSKNHLFELLGDSNKTSGMGLGLWLCQHIISRHGGSISHEDVPSGGACFSFTLPLIQA